MLNKPELTMDNKLLKCRRCGGIPCLIVGEESKSVVCRCGNRVEVSGNSRRSITKMWNVMFGAEIGAKCDNERRDAEIKVQVSAMKRGFLWNSNPSRRDVFRKPVSVQYFTAIYQGSFYD